MFSFSLGSKESVFCSHFPLFGEWPSGLCTILDNKWCCDPSLHPEQKSPCVCVCVCVLGGRVCVCVCVVWPL